MRQVFVWCGVGPVTAIWDSASRSDSPMIGRSDPRSKLLIGGIKKGLRWRRARGRALHSGTAMYVSTRDSRLGSPPSTRSIRYTNVLHIHLHWWRKLCRFAVWDYRNVRLVQGRIWTKKGMEILSICFPVHNHRPDVNSELELETQWPLSECILILGRCLSCTNQLQREIQLGHIVVSIEYTSYNLVALQPTLNLRWLNSQNMYSNKETSSSSYRD